jgi:Tfp pilus assembly protein PilF
MARADDPTPLEVANHFLLTGKYTEAEEKFDGLKDEQMAAIAMGKARCAWQTGRQAETIAILTKAIEKHPKAAALHAELAISRLAQGNFVTAETTAAAALAIDKDNLPAHWALAELLRLQGKLPEANRAYEWFVDYYNEAQPEDAESLWYIGRATAQFARWNRLSDQFSFLVNELYPDAIASDPDFWPARLEAGQLYAEKYNEAEAAKELKAAAMLNPNAAEVHAAMGALAVQNFEFSQAQDAVERALEINPKCLSAKLVQADVHLSNVEPQQAVDVLRGALELNPHHEATLGRMAAALAALDGLKEGNPGPRAQKIIEQKTASNPHAGEFYYAMAESFDKLRRYPPAAEYYRKAAEVMPQLLYAQGQEGLMLMRLGDEARARKLLEASFEADPFNVRVSNTIKVLEVLDDYDTLETEHFIIRFDPKYDRLLAKYSAAWLEEQYPLLCRQFGFTPPQKSLFEIFNRARNTDGHGWFSARMVGLPHIHTIGACAGQMVAMQAPTEGHRFNWARVLKHEFIHVLNLQQTNFNIPHWFTEALATLNEGYPRPKSWNDLLASRLAENKLFTLDNINLGFIRARNGDEWNLAYCQAELYAEFMIASFGEDALAKMLAAYADNLSTAAAIQRSFGIDQAEFENQYQQYVAKVVARLPKASQEVELSSAAIEKALKADPRNPVWLARSARVALDRKDYASARRQADTALKAEPKNQLAAYVRARLYLLLGETKPAIELLMATLDEAQPQPNLLSLLAGLRLKAEDCDEAARLYELGATADPTDTKWSKALASVYLKSKQHEKLMPVLARLAEIDADDFTIRKKLAELSIKARDFPAATRWARQAIQIDVKDAEIHGLLADALEASGSMDAARQERSIAKELTDGQP